MAASESWATEDALAAGPYDASLEEAISADLIDLSELRAALDRPPHGPVLRLTMDEAVQLALANNPDIVIADYEPEKAAADLYAARGEFDPVLQQNLSYTDASTSLDQRVRSFIGISELGTTSGYRKPSEDETLGEQLFLLTELISNLTQQLRGDTGFSAIDSTAYSSETVLGGKLHYGTQYAVRFDLEYEASTFDQFQGEYAGRIGLMLTQPILRGFGRHLNTIRIRAARNLREISEAQARLTVLNIISDVVNAYWDLVGAIENVKVQRESLANAERLLEINETRREIGTAADIEVAQSKAGVATRQGELISARARVRDASDRLKLLLDLQEGDYFSKATIVPTTKPADRAREDLDPAKFEPMLDASVEEALANRPEVEIADLQIENAELDAMKARNDMMPEFNITGMYAQGGRDHQLRDMLYGIKGGDHYFYSYGLEASVPIGNRAARGNFQRKKLTVREMELRNVLTNQILVESNRQARKLQEANVTAEMKRLRLGVTTSWQVLQVQEDLTAAQTLEVQALTALEKAVVDLQLAKGSLLDEMNIALALPEAEPAPGYFESIRPRWE